METHPGAGENTERDDQWEATQEETQGQSPAEERGWGNTPFFMTACVHGPKYIKSCDSLDNFAVKCLCGGPHRNVYYYTAVIFRSTRTVLTCVCRRMHCICVYHWGVTWALRECSDCLEIINNAGLSLSRLLRVQGKERMLSQVSNKSIAPIFKTIELSKKGPVL